MGFLSWFRGGNTTEAEPAKPAEGMAGWVRAELGDFAGGPATLAAKDQTTTQAIEAEQVSSGPPGIVFPWFPPYLNDWDTGSESAEMRNCYRQMMSDANVSAAITTQIFGVASLDLQIRPPTNPTRRDEEIADFNRFVFTEAITGGLHTLIWTIFSGGLIDGYSLSERLWDAERQGEWAGKLLFTGVKAKDVGNDVILNTDQYRNVVGITGLRYNAGKEWRTSRFVLYRHMSLYDSPVGKSALRAAYRAWWCLRVAQQLRMVFLERRAVPLIYGSYGVNSQKASLDKALSLAKSQNWLSVPRDVQLAVLNAAGGADEAFSAAIKDWKHDIFLAIQAASLPNIEGQVTNGGRGDTKVQQGQADLFKWWLSECAMSVLNDRKTGLVRDVTDLNYVTNRYPRATLSAVNPDDVTAELKNYSMGWSMGLDLSKQEIYDKCSWKPPTDPSDTLKGKPPGPAPGAGGPPAPGAPGAPGASAPSAVPAPEVPAVPAFPSFSEPWRAFLRRAG